MSIWQNCTNEVIWSVWQFSTLQTRLEILDNNLRKMSDIDVKIELKLSVLAIYQILEKMSVINEN